MLQSGVTDYAALNARVRVLYARLLNSISWAALFEANDFNALVTVLKRTDYGPYLESVKDKDLNSPPGGLSTQSKAGRIRIPPSSRLRLCKSGRY